jgi:hypothetical protein
MFRIDDFIVETRGRSGFSLTPIRLYEARYGRLNLALTPYHTTGNVYRDRRLYNKIVEGGLPFINTLQLAVAAIA